MAKTRNLTEGPIFKTLFFFTLPIMATGLLQVFYNMADNIVVGSYSGDELALAATGSTASLTALIVNFLMGFATGTGVIIAQHFGAKNYDNLNRAIHTAAALAMVGGVTLSIIAFVFAENFLTLMGTHEILLSRATLYFRIIALGIPASTIFNFGAAILRSVGNSKIQFYVLSTTGLTNVILNLIFVLNFKMTVDGVALATVISQYLSAISVIVVLLFWKDENARLRFESIKFHIPTLKSIFRIAIPVSLQSSLFAISNVIIQTAANTLPTLALSAKTIAGNIDNLVYTAINAYAHATTTFIAQNYGAKNMKRVKKTVLISAIQIILVGVGIGQLLLLFGEDLASIFIDPTDTNKAQVIEYAMEIMRILLNIYFLCGIMDMLTGVIRGLGNSILPMIIGICGVCGVRLMWVFFFFPMEPLHNLTGLYLSYPITWVFCITALSITLYFIYKKAKKKISESESLSVK